MIISVRGTSGSGKTHLARRLMSILPAPTPLMSEGRGRPLALDCGQVRFMGDYGVQQGGADTVRDPREQVFRLIDQWASGGYHVFYEGLMASNEVTRTLEMGRRHPTHVIFLTTPLDQCVEAINARRVVRGVDEPVSIKKTAEKYEELVRVRSRLRAAGIVQVHALDREAAFAHVCGLLGFTSAEASISL